MNDMKLPDGLTCLDCVHFRRCTGLIGIKGDETFCDWAPSRFRLDCIGLLCRLVKEGGATLTLYGKPVTEQQLRNFTETIVAEKIVNALLPDVPKETP